MTQEVHNKYFISYSYHDAKICDKLIANLPGNIEPCLFPPITVKPHQLITNKLIEAILGCKGLIYLNGSASSESFWVAFERDYALRSGKEVFAADPSTMSISKYEGVPLDLPVFPSYQRHDFENISQILSFLKHKRYFDLWIDREDIKPGTLWEKEITDSLTERINRGGYVFIFWSVSSASSQFVQNEIALASKEIGDFNDRVLFALLDKTPLPDFWRRFSGSYVQLYGDTERSAFHRMDDLIVELYWLIYRNTQHRHLEYDNKEFDT